MSATAVETRQAILNHSNRCDRCGSRAYVVLIFDAGELLFCGHHANKHLEAATPYINMVIDERWQLNEHVKDDHHVN